MWLFVPGIVELCSCVILDTPVRLLLRAAIGQPVISAPTYQRLEDASQALIRLGAQWGVISLFAVSEAPPTASADVL